MSIKLSEYLWLCESRLAQHSSVSKWKVCARMDKDRTRGGRRLWEGRTKMGKGQFFGVTQGMDQAGEGARPSIGV